MGWGARALLLLSTVGLTALASFVLSTAVMTGQWESLTWRRDLITELTSSANLTDIELQITWFLDDRVSKLAIISHKHDADPVEIGRLYLVPMDGGIWTLCVALTEKEQETMSALGLPRKECINYLNPTTETAKEEDSRSDWQQRMQNLSISCALVCLIILGSSALVGTFGILKHQISAVLVTGVMYLLAGVFALFTLTIIHFKRHSSECPGPEADGIVVQFGRKRLVTQIAEILSPARTLKSGWGLELGWMALGLCGASAGLWLILARVMRFSPRTTILS